MDVHTNSPSTSTPVDDSLVRCGPFFRFQQALGRPGRWNLPGCILLFIAIGWLPLALLAALFHPEGLISLLREHRVNSRMLIAVPAMLIGELLIDSRFHAVFQHIRHAELMDDSEGGAQE